MTKVDPFPDGYPRVVPYLHVDGADAAIDFYREVLGTTERMRMPGDSPEKIGHAELELGDSVIMVADEFPAMGALGPRSVGGSSVTVLVYVEDVDAVFAKAIGAGAEAIDEPTDQFYGDRSAQFEDPFGHRWSIATHVEDITPEEMQRRMEALFSGG